jgi:membrane protein implicated in regulation of membrane protease activity
VAAWNGRRIDRAWRAAWIDRGLCPACGASIANVPTRGDGLRTCATCDASWRLEPGARLLPVGRVDASHRGAHTRARSPFFGPPIVDDRGRAYTLDRTIPGVIARGHGIDRRRIRAALGFGTPEEMAVVFSAMVIVLVAGMSAQGGLAHAPGWSIAVLVVGVPLLAALLTLTALRPWSARVRRCASRRLCLCAACGRKLDAIEPAEDGCRVCEGCGSAWTIDGSVEGSAS